MPAILTQARKKLRKRVQADDLSPRQRDALTFMLECWTNGYIPVIREIGTHMGIGTPNGVMAHLRPLRKRGYIDNEDRCLRFAKTRGMEVERRWLNDDWVELLIHPKCTEQ